MRDAQPSTIYLKDYQVPDFLIDKTELDISLYDDYAEVIARLHLRRNPLASDAAAPLVLDGQELQLQSVILNQRELTPAEFSVSDDSLTIPTTEAEFILETRCHIQPHLNTSLEGLYRSRTMYCTQCEAEGFRKITYYLDRPDVLSEFVTRVSASKSQCPVLLSNGNPIEQGDLADNRHYAVWHDPFRKPAYLFALVAGDLAVTEDEFVTCSGRRVALKIFVEPKDLDKCDHAMQSLKHSMRWDEEVYGREYDLDIFMIVAVDDFNMGAMENKGLNIFNTSCVLAKPETTTDLGFQRVEAVVAHEYFHNWSGNRVTCRDWFQLSLKEGFTVFRDAEFSADMGSRTVKRVEDVTLLRTLQFAEDGGPMAHPVRPASFMEISNFYTLTVYEKGAEVVRMIHTLLGPELFRKGSDIYFERHDGEAATIENFVGAMEEASGRNLSQFMLWYSQAGTPRVRVTDHYDAEAQTYTLHLEQLLPDTPESRGADKQPMLIPIEVGLLGDAGNLPLQLADTPADPNTADNTTRVLELTSAKQSFVFTNISELPTPVLLRNFSAPVKLHYDYSREQLVAIMSRDADGFSRWDASQKLAVDMLHQLMDQSKQGQAYQLDDTLITAFADILGDTSLDPAMVALMLQLPSEAYLAEIAEEADIDAIHTAREFLANQLAEALQEQFLASYQRNQLAGEYRADAESVAARSLKNISLGYLARIDSEVTFKLVMAQLQSAGNMTDESAALTILVNMPFARAETAKLEALEAFYRKWQDESLVVNLWLSIQASNSLAGGLARVQSLMQHPAFEIKNPNKVRAVVGAFCNNNPVNFHDLSGSGYRFLADQIITLNKLNPQIAARQLTPLTKWRKYSQQRQSLMREQLQRVMAQPDLSKDVFEVVSKSLA